MTTHTRYSNQGIVDAAPNRSLVALYLFHEKIVRIHGFFCWKPQPFQRFFGSSSGKQYLKKTTCVACLIGPAVGCTHRDHHLDLSATGWKIHYSCRCQLVHEGISIEKCQITGRLLINNHSNYRRFYFLPHGKKLEVSEFAHLVFALHHHSWLDLFPNL